MPLLLRVNPPLSLLAVVAVSGTKGYGDVEQFRQAANYVHMNRIAADVETSGTFSWSHVASTMVTAIKYMGLYQGLPSVHGYFYPDMDMLPLDQTRAGTTDQERSVMSVWSILQSPLMYGGPLINPHPASIAIATNPWMMTINQFSYNQTLLRYNTSVFVVQSQNPHNGDVYGTYTNLQSSTVHDTFFTPYIASCTIVDIWNNVQLTGVSSYAFTLTAYQTMAVVMTACIPNSAAAGTWSILSLP
jgi:hypothetical protein